MLKRSAVGVLWFLSVGWAANFLAAFTGQSDAIGPLVGVASGLFAGIDPLHLIWRVERSAADRSTTDHSIRIAVPTRV